MMEEIDFKTANYTVEYGPGTGVFTKKLLEKRNPKTIMLLVEQNNAFYLILKEKFKDEKMYSLSVDLPKKAVVILRNMVYLIQTMWFPVFLCRN